MTVEWFLSPENNRWLGWKRITQNIRTFDGDKMAAGAFGRARNYG